jgi:hypothetical protein
MSLIVLHGIVSVVSSSNDAFYAKKRSAMPSRNKSICQQTSRLFSIKSKIKPRCAPETFCKIGKRWKNRFVISLSTSSSMSASDVIHPWHAFTKFTARSCGKNTMSESGSSTVAARRRSKSRPSALALLAVIPEAPAASSLRYRSRRGGSDPDCATQSVIARGNLRSFANQFGTIT